MPDLEFPEIQQLLSVPADSIPGQVSRRRFLWGAMASAGAMSVLPSIFDPQAAAAGPAGPTDSILVVLQLGGGNDGLNTVVPRADSRYQALRGPLAVTAPLMIDAKTGLHPALPKLKARYDAGNVAVVQGVGQPGDDHSHFSSTATWMLGTAGDDHSTGWLGRWLDGVPDSTAGLRAVTLGASVPLHLLGRRAVVTALDTDTDPFGADRSRPGPRAIYDTVTAFGHAPTGKGALADDLARSGANSIGLAGDLNTELSPRLPDATLASQLTLAARLVNADLGVRVFNATLGSFDTHYGELDRHEALLKELDDGIEALYESLDARWADRVTILTFSEFGRRVAANASGGTDHGAGSSLFVVGNKVKGGLYGQAPDLGRLTERGDVAVSVDFRSVYGSVLGPWLGGDPGEVLGKDFEDLHLFK